MYTCNFCGKTIEEGQWRIERYKRVFCNNTCMGSFASALQPQSFDALPTRVIPRLEPPTVHLDKKGA